MIHLYYGWGKGKTCSAVGQTIRMVGHGKTAMFCQFLKDGASGEVEALTILNVDYLCPLDYLNKGSNNELFLKVNNLTKLFDYDIIILDEILDAIDGGAITDFELGRFIIQCEDRGVELIITGHNRPDERIVILCDYVTYFQKIKHPFDKGILAREGIEY
jgi:cob(I)alamin adenosyltransferase